MIVIITKQLTTSIVQENQYSEIILEIELSLSQFLCY